MNESQFYLVWQEGSLNSTPSFKHESYKLAKLECERLARKNGGKFHILAHVATATRNDVIFEEVSDIPF